MNRLTLTRSALGLAVATLSSAALADTVSTAMPVTTSIAASCAVEATILAFGSLEVGVAKAAQSVVTVTCDTGTAYNVAMNAGQNPTVIEGGTYRGMTAADGGKITYCLNTNAFGCGHPWGDSDFDNSFPEGSSLPGTGDGNAQALDVYAYALADGTNSGVGSHSDLVTVTVHF